MEIKKLKTKKDCKIYDDLFSKLIKYESGFDKVILDSVKVSGFAEKHLDDKYVYMAYAKEGDSPIGFIFGFLKSSKGKVNSTNVFVVDGIYVEEEYRRQGVGKKLLDSFEYWINTIVDDKDYVIEITSIDSNTNAQGFYNHLGYGAVKTIVRKGAK